MAKAMDPHTLVAFEMNGKPIPALNGCPVRLIAPGWPGSASQKWLSRIAIRNKVHDGPGMTGMSYRVPTNPVKPGEQEPVEGLPRSSKSMPVKSIITNPASGTTLAA